MGKIHYTIFFVARSQGELLLAIRYKSCQYHSILLLSLAYCSRVSPICEIIFFRMTNTTLLDVFSKF